MHMHAQESSASDATLNLSPKKEDFCPLWVKKNVAICCSSACVFFIENLWMTVCTINLRAVFFILFGSLYLLGDVGQAEKKQVYCASYFKVVQDFSAVSCFL